MNKTKKKFSEAINDALFFSLKKDKNLLCYGLGINDPKRTFSTTFGLLEKFGKKRVFEVPNSENTIMGLSVGAAIGGIKSVITHQRLDFFLLAMDQLVNSAAKWKYMFGRKKSLPITIRLIIGRGWGQGPTHSQNLQSWFYHIPGLKIVCPSNPMDAKELLINSIFDPNPVIFIEHRWLHNVYGYVKKAKVKKLELKKVLKSGKDLTLISNGYLTIEAIKASEILKSHFGIELEIIDLKIIKPLNLNLIFNSVKKTKRIICLDTGMTSGSISSDIVSKILTKYMKKLKSPPIIMGLPDVPIPSTYSGAKFYINYKDIVFQILKLMKIKKKVNKKLFKLNKKIDIPGNWFKGPF
tara:strand:- start:4912 stop:5970 length:1059 start_codon:yes stop_codon:yes gene_type:complete